MKKKMQMGGSAESNKFTIPSKNKISIPKKVSKDSSAESNVFTIPSRNKISIPKKTMKMGGKAKNGGAFGMLSVKAGIDKNPNPTAADRIAGATKKAKSGASMKKCKYGCK